MAQEMCDGGTWDFHAFSLSIGAAKVFHSVMSAGAKKVLLTIDEVGPMGTGDTIYERSHYCFYKEDGSVFDQGKYVQTYQKFASLCGNYRPPTIVTYHNFVDHISPIIIARNIMYVMKCKI